ncbi:MAG: hypothetical protein R2787_17530 [Saprospiraceae bacterium]
MQGLPAGFELFALQLQAGGIDPGDDLTFGKGVSFLDRKTDDPAGNFGGDNDVCRFKGATGIIFQSILWRREAQRC